MKKLIDLLDSSRFPGTKKTFRKNSLIYLEGDIIGKICIVESGSVRSEKTYLDGEIHIIDIFGPGEIFALEIAVSRTRKAATDYISNEDSVLRFIPLSAVTDTDCTTEISNAINHELADDIIRRSHKIEILAERGLRDRIIMYLGILQRKSGRNTVNVKMSREQLAQYLCVNRSALSNELNVMKREGIIDFKGSKFTLIHTNQIKGEENGR